MHADVVYSVSGLICACGDLGKSIWRVEDVPKGQGVLVHMPNASGSECVKHFTDRMGHIKAQ